MEERKTFHAQGARDLPDLRLTGPQPMTVRTGIGLESVSSDQIYHGGHHHGAQMQFPGADFLKDVRFGVMDIKISL